MTRLLLAACAVLFCLVLSACGGSSSSPGHNEPTGEGFFVDNDADGIFDAADNCPATNNPDQVDSDNDNVGDACDQCSGTADGATADNNGCAAEQLDTDGDGVDNDADQCPGTPSNTAVDSSGCPDANADSDMDGVSDAQDVCPNSVLKDSNDNDFEFFASGCPKVTLAREGISYDVFLSSDVDNERVAFTIHEPRNVDPADTYPMIAHSHGYSQSRTSSRAAAGGNSLFSRLADNGYGAYSMDQRGHGESGGQIRLLDPDVEGQDMLHILDWMTNNVSWLAFEDSNQTDYLMGSFGSSYGGGFQHTLLRLDPLNRLDVMVPDITWNDLRYSINTNNVFKTKWAVFLTTVAQSTPGGHHDQVNAGLQRGVETGDLNDEEKRLLYRSSMAYNCDETNTGDFIPRASNGVQMDVGRPITSIPALYTQGTSDTLFDLTETYRNVKCLQDNDPNVDVRVFTQLFGHDDLAGTNNCGGIENEDVIMAFYDHHLKGDSSALNNFPSFCFNLGGTSVQRSANNAFPFGTAGNPNNSFTADLVDPITSTPLPFALSEANATVQTIPVYTAVQNGEVLFGVPTINLEITRTAGSDAVPDDGILFVGIAISTDGGLTFRLPNQTATGTGQVTPFRDTELTANTTYELAGIEVLLNAGDQVAVLYSATDTTYKNSGTRTAGINATIAAEVQLPLIGVRGVNVTPYP